MQMRDDLTRKNNIPNKSNEFSPQEASFWPAIYTHLCDKSMSISAVNTCIWRVKSRRRGCITTPKTYKQMCMNKIQKMLMLGVFAPRGRLVVYTPNMKRQGVKKKFIRKAKHTSYWSPLEWNQPRIFLRSFRILRSTRMASHLAEKRKPKSMFAALGYFWPLLFR